MAVYAVVLAAGASTRYGTDPPKQVQLLPKVLAALGESSVDGVVVVSGAHPLPVESVRCPDWERGPGASLRCGLAALPPEAEAAVVVLADGGCRLRYSSGILRAASFSRSSAGICSVAALRT